MMNACRCQYVTGLMDASPVRFYRVDCVHWRAYHKKQGVKNVKEDTRTLDRWERRMEHAIPPSGVKVQHVNARLPKKLLCKQDRVMYRAGSTPGASILDETPRKAPKDRSDRYQRQIARYEALRAIPGAYDHSPS